MYIYICIYIYIYIYIGSIGGAPIPSSELVLTLSIYSTAFNTNVIPKGFAFLVAITWLQGVYICIHVYIYTYIFIYIYM
jgi:hypothetical protein